MMVTTLEDALKFIEQSTKEEMRQVVVAINARRTYLSQIAKMQFKKGDRVEFTHSDGRVVRGTVTGINPKTVAIRSDEQQPWRVSPGLLKKVQ